jgi:hypothetical protein
MVPTLGKEESPILRIGKQIEQLRGNFLLLLSPGDKQFKDLPKRVRLMVIAFVVPLFFVVLKVWLPSIFIEHLWAFCASILLGGITYAGMYWGVKGQVRKESYFSVMAMPTWFVLAYSMFLFTIFSGEINRVYLWVLFTVAISAFMILLYIIALTVNILNVTLFYTIPLSRLGESIAYMLGVITVFLVTYVADVIAIEHFQSKNYLNVGILVGVTTLVIFGITSYLWIYFVAQRKGHFWFTVLFSLLIVTFMGAFATIIDVPWKLATMVSVVSYVLYGQVIHKEQNTFSLAVLVEFLLVIVGITVVFIAL